MSETNDGLVGFEVRMRSKTERKKSIKQKNMSQQMNEKQNEIKFNKMHPQTKIINIDVIEIVFVFVFWRFLNSKSESKSHL